MKEKRQDPRSNSKKSLHLEDESENIHIKTGTSRRNFLKFGAIGAGAAAAGAAGITTAKRMEGIPVDTFPLPINNDFKPIDQRNVIHTFAYSKALNQKHPERINSLSPPRL